MVLACGRSSSITKKLRNKGAARVLSSMKVHKCERGNQLIFMCKIGFPGSSHKFHSLETLIFVALKDINLLKYVHLGMQMSVQRAS